jgi:hypothetical protein
MTGYKSKLTAALDEDGMYLVHHTKRKDDDIQVYKKPWVGLTDDEIQELRKNFATLPAIAAIEAKLKEKNNG